MATGHTRHARQSYLDLSSEDDGDEDILSDVKKKLQSKQQQQRQSSSIAKASVPIESERSIIASPVKQKGR